MVWFVRQWKEVHRHHTQKSYGKFVEKQNVVGERLARNHTDDMATSKSNRIESNQGTSFSHEPTANVAIE